MIFNPNDLLLTPEMMKVWGMTVTPGSGHIFVTGKAGSGKTTFLKYLKDMSAKSLVITAPTGVAAVNAGGVTLHSLFMLPIGPIIPGMELENNISRTKKQTIKSMEILVIDEISMVRPDVLDAVDYRLRTVRKNNRPFGGVQVIMFGDLFQLPPIIPEVEWNSLKTYYTGEYFFNAKVWDETGFEKIELTRIFRQTDQRFIDILNNLRTYQTSSQDLQDLNLLSASVKGQSVPQEVFEKTIHLCTHKVDAQNINDLFLNKILSPGVCTTTYTGCSDGKFPSSSFPNQLEVTLCPGARVMSLINNPTEGYYNGSLGTVLSCNTTYVTVLLDDGGEVNFWRHTWDNTEYIVDPKTKKVTQNVIGTYTQIPLIPAWAITIHKSQGLTFDNVFLHIKNIFSSGQLYVALSRCRSMSGIIMDTTIEPKMIFPNPTLLEFIKYLENHGSYYTRV